MTDRDPAETHRIGEARLASFTAGIPAEVRAEAERLPRQLELMNASPAAKIRRVHAMTDRIFSTAGPLVACARGCAHCCYVSVPISRAEAAYIGERIGVAPVDIQTSLHRDEKSFSYATPCTFLRNDECTIYEHRPMTCRSHFSFDRDNYWCRHENWEKPGAAIPKPNFTILRDAYMAASARKGERPVFADIRDFFPAPQNPGEREGGRSGHRERERS